MKTKVYFFIALFTFLFLNLKTANADYAATVSYSCPSGGILSGTTCNTSSSTPATVDCSKSSHVIGECPLTYRGAERIGDNCYAACQTQFGCGAGGHASHLYNNGISAQVCNGSAWPLFYVCPSGTTLSGANCVSSSSYVATSTYTCPSGGVLSGTTCLLADNGSCGTANRTFAASETSWGSYSACASGSATLPTFPSAGSSASWTCVGTGTGHTNASCSASRSQAAGSCGTANGVSTSSPPTSGLCSPGSPSAVTTNTNSYDWTCTGGTTANCSAPRTGQSCNSPCGGTATSGTWGANCFQASSVTCPATCSSSAGFCSNGAWTTPYASGFTSSSCTQIPCSYSCTGTVPLYATIFSGDNTGLTVNTPYTFSASNTGTKCEYSCNSGYTWNGSACEAVPTATLSISLTANPTSGTIPFTSQITAALSGTATGNSVYSSRSCGTGGLISNVSTAGDSFNCTYSAAGTYSVSTYVTRQSILAFGSTTVTVTAPTAPTNCTLPNGTIILNGESKVLFNSNSGCTCNSISRRCTNGILDGDPNYEYPSCLTIGRINNACDPATNGQTFTSAPTTNLCSVGSGIAFAETASGWQWACGGTCGGTTESCSANKPGAATPPTKWKEVAPM